MRVLIESLTLLLLLAACRGKTVESSASSLTRKRILKELKEIRESRLSLDTPFNRTSVDECGVRLSPLRSNLLEWHFSFSGAEDSAYEGGIYHGRIILHPTCMHTSILPHISMAHFNTTTHMYERASLLPHICICVCMYLDANFTWLNRSKQSPSHYAAHSNGPVGDDETHMSVSLLAPPRSQHPSSTHCLPILQYPSYLT